MDSEDFSFGLPTNGLINSESNNGFTYQLQPYNNNNVLKLQDSEIDTLYLETPKAFESISVLAATGSGQSSLNVRFVFEDGTVSNSYNTNVDDWFEGENYAIKGLDRVDREENIPNNSSDNPRLYDHLFTLNNSDSKKNIAKVVFEKTDEDGSFLGVFALCGVNTNYQSFKNIAVSGFNEDVVAEGADQNTATTSVTTSAFDGENQGANFYAAGYRSDMDNFFAGLPNDGAVESSKLGIAYQMQDFDENNVLKIRDTETDTLFLNNPTAYTQIAILNSSSQGTSDLNVRLVFADNSVSSNYGLQINDWFDNTNASISSLGFVHRLTDQSENGNFPSMFDTQIILSDEDATKSIKKVAFEKLGADGSFAGIFALSGVEQTTNNSNLQITACNSYQFGDNELTESGTYTNILTNKLDGDSIITLNLTIKYRPEVPSVYQPDPVCDSGSFMLNAYPTYNNRIQCRECGDDNIYLWKNAQQDSVYNDADFQTPMLYGYTTYSVTAANECGISDPTQVDIYIYNVGAPTLTSDTICSGNTATLSASYNMPSRLAKNARKQDSGADFVWFNANGDSLATTNEFTTNTLSQNTDYFVKVKFEGCVSAKEKTSVLVYEKPVVTTELNNLTVCNNSMAKFKVVADGNALKYTWGMKVGEDWMVEQSETKDSVEFNADAETNEATIFTIVSNGCSSDTSVANLYVNVVDTAVSVENGTITANVANQEYQWVNMDTKTVIDGATNQAFTPTQTGIYAAVISQNFGKGRFCTDTSGARYVELTLTGLSNAKVANFSIYPNPASDNVTITFTESVSGTVSIVDLKGNVVATKSISGNTTNISTADLASGVYVVKIGFV